MDNHIKGHSEYITEKNAKSLEYIEKYNFTKDELFKKILLSDGDNAKEVLSLLENGLTLISEDQEKAKIYFLSVSLLDNINRELSSVATDIMLYTEDSDNKDISKEFSSIDDIRTVLTKYKQDIN